MIDFESKSQGASSALHGVCLFDIVVQLEPQNLLYLFNIIVQLEPQNLLCLFDIIVQLEPQNLLQK